MDWLFKKSAFIVITTLCAVDCYPESINYACGGRISNGSIYLVLKSLKECGLVEYDSKYRSKIKWTRKGEVFKKGFMEILAL